jgi:hypothetical protein
LLGIALPFFLSPLIYLTGRHAAGCDGARLSRRIFTVYRITSDIGVEVQIILVPHRAGLQDRASAVPTSIKILQRALNEFQDGIGPIYIVRAIIKRKALTRAIYKYLFALRTAFRLELNHYRKRRRTRTRQQSAARKTLSYLVRLSVTPIGASPRKKIFPVRIGEFLRVVDRLHRLQRCEFHDDCRSLSKKLRYLLLQRQT